MHSSNLCTEITLNTSADETAVCNLGSINLSKHIVDGKLDKDLLKDALLSQLLQGPQRRSGELLSISLAMALTSRMQSPTRQSRSSARGYTTTIR